MPRPERKDYPFATHHVSNWTLAQNPVFADPACARQFIEFLAELPERFNIKVHGYCLLPDRFHLMLETPDANLSVGMSQLLSRFTKAMNKHRGLEGPVFRGRFRSCIVESDEHWRHLLAVLHSYPTQEVTGVELGNYPFSSHLEYAGLRAKPKWLTRGSLLDSFGGTAAYDNYLNQNLANGSQPPGFHNVLLRRAKRPDGELTFESIREKYQTTLEQTLAGIELVTGATLEELRTIKRGRHGNTSRVFAAYWLVGHTGLSNGETSVLLGMSPSSVSQAISRVNAAAPESLLVAYKILLEEMEHLEAWGESSSLSLSA